ncbi:MAG: sulfatase-like hydrolase/transferase, partial [Lentisphaeraceae bacterium]|nr:sulfatase-like hydrolase/transferase [Lentisphaeraceae bacterium]
MNTYSTGKLYWVLSSFLLLAGMSLYSQSKPNVILILTDDQGFGDWGWNGQHPYLNTPEIDKLSQDGVFMTDFHGVALCGPSRAALMSGRHCYYTRVWQGRHKMRADIPTMGNVFKENGYKTAMYGKWHLGQEYPFGPQHRGFDDTICIGSGMVTTIEDYPGNNAATLTDLTLRHNGEFKKFEDQEKYPNGYYSTDLWFDKAREFIGNRGDDPFFVMISTDAPHAPHVAHPLFKNTFNGVSGIDDKTKAFYGQLLGVDYQLGKLREYLANEQLTNNTVIVFMSDNGSAVAANVYNGPAVDSSAPAGANNNFNISGGKASNPDGGHRVPFFVYYPDGGVTGGRRSNVLSNNIDIIPTLIDLCGLQSPVANNHWEGVSLASILKGNSTTLSQPNRFLHQGYSTAYEPPVGKGGVGMRADWRLFGNGAMFNMASDITQSAQTVNQTIKNEMNAEWDAQLSFFNEKVFPFEDPFIIGSDKHPLTRITTSSWIGNGLGFWQDLNDPFNPNKKQFGNYLVKAAKPGKYSL